MEGAERGGFREEGVAAATMVAAVARWMCERTDDRTDGVHKARRAKLDREQKEREDARGWGGGEGENEHAVAGWGAEEEEEDKGARAKGWVSRERERERKTRNEKRCRGCERCEKKGGEYARSWDAWRETRGWRERGGGGAGEFG